MNTQKLIYHYTDMNALIGMLKDKQLWLSDIATMNDKNEIVEMIQALRKDLEKCEIDQEKARELLYYVENEYCNTVYLASCFSFLEDDAAMWERYADNAHGVCIKFDTQKFEANLDKGKYLLDEVKYSKDADYLYILDVVKQTINKYGNSTNWFGQTREVMPLFVKRFAMLFKNAGFKSECEVRLCSRSNYINKDVSHYITRNGTVKYIEKMPFLPHEAISEIILGPRSLQNINVFKNYVRILGYPVIANSVRYSNCSLR